ncbi:VWA domain-containing protein [Xanthomonadaceae bacterium JHOS43]|nr:VWA domain-containing protein [Xanthomonadaceae bacterium JHOS43]
MSSLVENFHFLRPAWLLALALLPALWWTWRRQQHRADPWRRICDPQLLPHLSQSAPGALRGGMLPWLFAVGFVLLVVALAGPAFRQVPQPVVRLQSPLIVAVDLSDRMRSTDLKPSRIARVRFKLADLIARRGEGQTALIGYAGDAFTVAPLTDDAASLADLAAALAPDVMPLQGQRADRAIDLALQLLHDTGQSRGELLLLTDGADARAEDAARRAHAAGLTVSVLGVGTAQGAPVPQARGGFVLDQVGAILIPRLDTSALTALARAGGGRYAEVTVDDADLRNLGVAMARKDGGEETVGDERTRRDWRDEGPWVLLLVLPLAALAFRRGWLACIVVVMVLPAPPARAVDWSSLWQRPDQRAWDAMQQGDIESARKLARDPALSGAAAYRDGDYAAAIEQFSAGSDATAHYNRGNALAKAHRYEEAIAAYDQALALQPDFPDAAANRQAVADWLKQQPEQQPQQGDESKNQSGDEGDSESSEGGEPEQGEGGEGQDSSSGGDQQPPGEEQEGSEQSDAGDEESAQDGVPENGEGGPEQDAQPPDDAQDEAERYAEEMQQALEQAAAEESEPGQPMMTTEEAERQQAMEHLLQRVPDDPGGLLRRKFQLEFQRRQQEGGRR